MQVPSQLKNMAKFINKKNYFWQFTFLTSSGGGYNNVAGKIIGFENNRL